MIKTTLLKSFWTKTLNCRKMTGDSIDVQLSVIYDCAHVFVRENHLVDLFIFQNSDTFDNFQVFLFKWKLTFCNRVSLTCLEMNRTILVWIVIPKASNTMHSCPTWADVKARQCTPSAITLFSVHYLDQVRSPLTWTCWRKITSMSTFTHWEKLKI